MSAREESAPGQPSTASCTTRTLEGRTLASAPAVRPRGRIWSQEDSWPESQTLRELQILPWSAKRGQFTPVAAGAWESLRGYEDRSWEAVLKMLFIQVLISLLLRNDCLGVTKAHRVGVYLLAVFALQNFVLYWKAKCNNFLFPEIKLPCFHRFLDEK